MMIKKSLICFAALVGLHFLLVLSNPSIGSATHQWQDNLIKAQTFLYTEDTDTVMVGTSLSARIIRDSIPSVTSISLGGCSVEDGLRITSSKKHLPRYILVEGNLLLYPGNKELVASLTEGVIPTIKGWIPSLREQYQPICILASLLLKSGNINPQAGNTVIDMNLLNDRIEQIQREDVRIDDKELKRRLAPVKQLIEHLEKQGVKFIFFEMPVNERLYHLNRYAQTREILKREFPADKYCYLPSDTTKYLTTDGEHLDFTGQQVFSHFFKRALADKEF